MKKEKNGAILELSNRLNYYNLIKMLKPFKNATSMIFAYLKNGAPLKGKVNRFGQPTCVLQLGQRRD